MSNAGENGPQAITKKFPVIEGAGIALVVGAAFLLFGANDNILGGGKEPDEDDLWENLKKLFNIQ